MSIIIPKYCNLLNFEEFLKEEYQNSKKSNSIVFDFSDLCWIGTLQLSLLYGWMKELKDNRKEVSINLLKEEKSLSIEEDDECEGIPFLIRTGFFYKLEKLGVSITGKITQGNTRGLAAFLDFPSYDELLAFEKELDDPITYSPIIGGGEDVSLVRDGDLKEIIIHELGENAFVHGAGNTVRCAVSEFKESKERKGHKILSNFEGKAYIEVVFSDSGPGLLKKMKKVVVPEGYPHNIEVTSRKLSNNAKKALYAFEFSTTSDEESRRKRLNKIIKDAGKINEAVPTGLFHSYVLAQLYGGQIIVRTGKLLLSVDFSVPSTIKVFAQNQPATVLGTHLLIRVPKERHLIKPIQVQGSLFQSKSLFRSRHIALAGILNECTDDADFIVRAEKAIEDALLLNQQQGIHLMTILCDGLSVHTKTLSLLLISISILPRRGQALILFGLKNEVLKSAEKQWIHIQELPSKKSRLLNRVNGYRSFLIVNEELSDCFEFGYTGHQDSTKFTQKSTDNNFKEFDWNDLIKYYQEALKKELCTLIDQAPVKHPHAYYLLEGKYYTRTFFEIGKLFSLKSGIGLTLSANYLRLLLRTQNVDIVLTLAEPLWSLADYLSKSTTNIGWFRNESKSTTLTISQVQRNKKENSKILILTDVICSTEEIRGYLLKFENLDNILICGFVDGRPATKRYLTIEKPDKAYTIDVLNIKQCKIEPIYDLPHDIEPANVPIIDTVTHAPTSSVQLKIPKILPVELISKSFESEALYHGHFIFFDKHYTDLLFFGDFFKSIRLELENWWDTTLANIQRGSIQTSELLIFYLDEQRGWEDLVPKFFQNKKFKPKAISRDNLFAPPIKLPKKKDGGRVATWFILPAIANGETTRQCLEYASRLNPDIIHISIVVARMEASRLSFYQNIKGFKECTKVSIENLTYLPITAYTSKSSCPKCNVVEIIIGLQFKVEKYEMLSDIVNKRYKFLKAQDVSIEDLKLKKISLAKENDKERLLIKSFFGGGRNIERRKALSELLDKPGGVQLFIEMVGDEFLSPEFTEEKVKHTTYKKYNDIKQAATEHLEQHRNEASSIKMLFGIHRLFPELMVQNYKELFAKSIDRINRQLAEDLVFLALMFPEQYGLAVSGEFPNINLLSDWRENLSKEIRAYTHWHNAEESYVIEEFLEVLWLLKRSTPWGSNIENLRCALQAKSNARTIKSGYRELEYSGIKRVLQLLDKIKSREERDQSSLWSALMANDEGMESSIRELRKHCEKLKPKIEDYVDNRRYDVLLALAELDRLGRKIKMGLERLFINPIDVESGILELLPLRWPTINLTVNFDIAPNQPGILFSLSELVTCLGEVIDNAYNCIGNDDSIKYWIEFCFYGYTNDGNGALLIVKDNIPWAQKIEPTGGMKLLVRGCRKYAAHYDFDPQGSEKDEKFRIIFRIDNIGERYEFR